VLAVVLVGVVFGLFETGMPILGGIVLIGVGIAIAAGIL